MKLKAHLLVFEGLSDWEPAYAMCAIANSKKFDVVTVGLSGKTVKTMGGLSLIPDISISSVLPAETGILLVPGGSYWERESNEEVTSLLQQLHSHSVPIAAICSGTLEVARAGLTHNIQHTSNAREYLKMFVSDYNDSNFYVEEPAVTDQNVITANGLCPVEFGRAIIEKLNLFNKTQTQAWFEMWKHGVYVDLETLK